MRTHTPIRSGMMVVFVLQVLLTAGVSYAGVSEQVYIESAQESAWLLFGSESLVCTGVLGDVICEVPLPNFLGSDTLRIYLFHVDHVLTGTAPDPFYVGHPVYSEHSLGQVYTSVLPGARYVMLFHPDVDFFVDSVESYGITALRIGDHWLVNETPPKGIQQHEKPWITIGREVILYVDMNKISVLTNTSL